MPQLRKKVCRKIYTIIHEEFKRPKEIAKQVTLDLEYRVNKTAPFHTDQYLKTIKLIFKKLRVSAAPAPLTYRNRSSASMI